MASGDLSVTAFYTAGTWAWGRLPGAEVFDTRETRTVFGVTNAALRLLNPLRKPELPRALLQRHVLLDRVVERAIEHSATRQVIELAAGLSRRGVHFAADPVLTYTEIDLPQMIARKQRLLDEAAARGRARPPGLRLAAGDALELDLAAFVNATGGPPLVLAEGLFMYLTREAQRALLAKIGALLAARGGTFAFDLVPPAEEPPAGPVGRALGAMMRRFTGGRDFVRDGRTRSDILAELAAAGLGRVEVLEPTRLACAWNLPFAETPGRVVVFVAAPGTS